MASKSNQNGAPLEIRSREELPKPDLPNIRLPLDILFQVFELYHGQETSRHPVETLLLVCKFWRRAALACPRLWLSFSIRLEAFEFWSSHVPARLKRSSPVDLLDISINVAGIRSGTHRNYIEEAIFQRHYEAILLPLTGPNGEVARRWRTFEVKDDYNLRPAWLIKPSSLARFLVYPTPNLQELRIRGIFSSLPIFPVAPALKIVSAHDLKLTSFPDLSSASEVTISMNSDIEKALAGAINMTSLRIFLGAGGVTSYRLPAAYQHLTSLRLTRRLSEESLASFSAPALRELFLDFVSGSEFLTVVSCNGIPLHRLQKLSIMRWVLLTGPGITPYCEGLRELLRAVKDVRILELRGMVPIALALKLLTTDCESLYQEHSVLLMVKQFEVELGRGEERHRNVRKLRENVGGIPDGTLDHIVKCLIPRP